MREIVYAHPMNVRQRSFRRDEDIRSMVELAAAAGDTALHVADLPYRLCSWALDEPENVGVWEDSERRIVGWAVVQFPFWTIGRAEELLGTSAERPCWFVLTFSEQTDRRKALEAAGFICQADVGEDSWSQVLLSRDDALAPAFPVVDGFTIRRLAGPEEVGAYVEAHRAAFDSTNMTVDWRARTLTAPHHLSETDLVAVTDDGRVAGFCIGWLHEGTRTGRIEPLGVLPEFHRHGLGAALLAECLTRLADCGATRLVVATDSYRDPARALYEGAGFVPTRPILVYRRDFVAS